MSETWKNDLLRRGVELREGIPVRRFPVAITRERYWFALRTAHHVARSARIACDAPAPSSAHWREALEDEFIRFQGPFCVSELHEFLG